MVPRYCTRNYCTKIRLVDPPFPSAFGGKIEKTQWSSKRKKKTIKLPVLQWTTTSIHKQVKANNNCSVVPLRYIILCNVDDSATTSLYDRKNDEFDQIDLINANRSIVWRSTQIERILSNIDDLITRARITPNNFPIFWPQLARNFLSFRHLYVIDERILSCERRISRKQTRPNAGLRNTKTDEWVSWGERLSRVASGVVAGDGSSMLDENGVLLRAEGKREGNGNNVNCRSSFINGEKSAARRRFLYSRPKVRILVRIYMTAEKKKKIIISRRIYDARPIYVAFQILFFLLS